MDSSRSALYLRLARRDLVNALAADRSGTARGWFRLTPNGDGWLATPDFGGRAGHWLWVTRSARRTASRGSSAPWVLEIARDAVELKSTTDTTAPVVLQVTGPGEVTLDLRAPTRGPSAVTVAPVRFSRVAGAMGLQAWRRLASLRVLLVGTSRTGSQLARILVRAGLGSLVLVDPDLIEAHNLDALGSPDDLGLSKAAVLADELRRTLPRTDVHWYGKEVDRLSIARIASNADMVVSCVDDAAARQTCAWMATSFLRTHVDVGTGVWRDERGLIDAGADVRIIAPGDGCLACVGGLAEPGSSHRGQLPGGRIGSDPGLNALAAASAFRLMTGWLAGERGTTWWRAQGDRTELIEPKPARGCGSCRQRGGGFDGLRNLSRAESPTAEAQL